MKKVIFVPLPFYGHIIPALKLANRFKQDEWSVTFFIVSQFAEWLSSQGFDVVDDVDHMHLRQLWYSGYSADILVKLDCFFHKNIPHLATYDLALFDYATSICAISTAKLGVRSVTYVTNADCDGLKSLPISVPFYHKIPLIVAKLFATLRLRYLIKNSCINAYFVSVNFCCKSIGINSGRQANNNLFSEVKNLGLSFFPNVPSLHINVNTVVLGPKSLSQNNFKSDKYFGFCVTDTSLPANVSIDDFFNTHQSVTYFTFGTGFGHFFGRPFLPDETPRELSICIDIITLFDTGKFGAIIVQASHFKSRLEKYNSQFVKVIEYADQKYVLSRCHFAIIHGGFGTLKECIYYSVPPLVIPYNFDQFYNALLVRKQSIGCVLYPQDASKSNIEKALVALQNNTIYSEKISGLYSDEFDLNEFENAYGALVAS